MKPHLPTLHGLRAFEAAARLGAFNKAADELNVTATAISHHIRSLEESLGTSLFLRNTRRIVLTADGRKLHEACGPAFEALKDAVASIKRQNARQTITIALGPLLASRWLTPRLNRFWNAFSTIDLQLVHTPLRVDPQAISADIYLVWGEGDWPGLDSVPFLVTHGVPVASPDYLDAQGRPHTAEQLLEHPLIHQRSTEGWRRWLAAHAVKLPEEPGGIVIEDANVVLRSAISAQGIALGWLPLIETEISAGRLVPLFPPRSFSPLGYHLITSPKRDASGMAAKVVEWLLEEAGKEAGEDAGEDTGDPTFSRPIRIED